MPPTHKDDVQDLLDDTEHDEHIIEAVEAAERVLPILFPRLLFCLNESTLSLLSLQDELGAARTGVPVATRPLFRLDNDGEKQTSSLVPINDALDSSVPPTTPCATAETSASVPVNDALDSGRPHEYPRDVATDPDGPCTPHQRPPSGA